MPDFHTEINIDPWEYVSSCDSREIEELIETLVEDGHLSNFNGKVTPKKDGGNVMDIEWGDMLTKIRDSKHLLSNEDESIIVNISKKLI